MTRTEKRHTTSVIVTARQIESDVRTIIESTIVSPGYAIRCWKVATSLSLVKIEKVS